MVGWIEAKWTSCYDVLFVQKKKKIETSLALSVTLPLFFAIFLPIFYIRKRQIHIQFKIIYCLATSGKTVGSLMRPPASQSWPAK